MLNPCIMKNTILRITGVSFFVVITLLTVSAMLANGDKGTLMGNAEGTMFCCAAGTNDCAAAKCGGDNE
jgi:hypothetical protein